MPARLIWDDHGRGYLKRLHPAPRRVVRRALRDFESLWRERTKPLTGYPGKYTASIGDYRVILREAEGLNFYVEHISHRSTAYDDYPMLDKGRD